MRYAVRQMRFEDITQVEEIDRECFHDHWPAVSYRRELSNNLARYLVAYDIDTIPSKPAVEHTEITRARHSSTWILRCLLHRDKVCPPASGQRVVGTIGFWTLVGEAHISTIAVREPFRRQGIGELLLISAIELAQMLDATVITLEVRASNTVAQCLYHKYGFTREGVRHGYYQDREDAIIMTTETVTSPQFQRRFQQLKDVHTCMWGPGERQLI